MSEAVVAETVAITVHGPFGSIDLVVPVAAAVRDVAREYSAQCGLTDLPRLVTTAGRALDPDAAMAVTGVRPGGLVIATPHEVISGTHRTHAQGGAVPGQLDNRPDPAAPRASLLPMTLATVVAVLAGLLAVHTRSTGLPEATLALLALGAAIGVLPVGRGRHQRGIAAPAFGASAGYLLAWQPDPATLPLTVGAAGLGAAVVAGVARAAGNGPSVVHDVWMVSGVSICAVTGGAVLAGVPPQVAWAVLLVAALIAGRSVASVAIDVPDEMVIDLEQLAVTAWSARDRPRGRRDRTVIREEGITEMLTRGTLIVESAAVAILVLVVIAVPNLLRSATIEVDRQGALALVVATGAALLLAARRFRQVRARTALRCAGLFAWGAVLVTVLGDLADSSLLVLLGVSLTTAGGALMAAVAIGRGWRSAAWASRADVAETVAGAIAIGSLVVATGLVRLVWEIPFVR